MPQGWRDTASAAVSIWQPDELGLKHGGWVHSSPVARQAVAVLEGVGGMVVGTVAVAGSLLVVFSGDVPIVRLDGEGDSVVRSPLP